MGRWSDVVAQINFYTSEEDREELERFIVERGGYIFPLKSARATIPVISANRSDAISNRLCRVGLDSVVPSDRFDGSAFVSPYQGGYYLHVPGLEYMRSEQVGSVLCFGRMYTGTIDVPGTHCPDGSLILRDGSVVTRERAKEMIDLLEGLYRSCAAFVRRRFRKAGGIYHGPGSDSLEHGGVTKGQMAPIRAG